MQSSLATLPWMEDTRQTHLAEGWPAPASETSLQDIETGVLEREIKFAVPSLVPIEGRLSELEGTEARFCGVTRERNCVLDTEAEDLKARDERLRVREIDGKSGVQVTWKGPATRGNGLRRREEREFLTDNREACLAVLTNLGLRPVRFYDKVRSTWRVGDIIVCLDTLPFGCFVELELTAEVDESEEASAVEGVVNLLGLEDAQPIQASYARLQQEWQEVLNKYSRKADKASR